jgi:hypothetical protein
VAIHRDWQPPKISVTSLSSSLEAYVWARLYEPQQLPQFHTLEFIPARLTLRSCCDSETRAPALRDWCGQFTPEFVAAF